MSLKGNMGVILGSILLPPWMWIWMVRGRKAWMAAPLRTSVGVAPWKRVKAFVKLSGVS